MPRPPDLDFFQEINFVTNMVLLGCQPPFALFVQFAKEPAGELLVGLFGFTAQDFAQALFDPRSGRRRKSARHGRKRRKGGGIPDVHDVLARKIKGDQPLVPAKPLSPTSMAFTGLNLFELGAITAFFLDKVEDVAFEGLYGAFALDGSICHDVPRMARSEATWSNYGAGPAGYQPMSISDLDFAVGIPNSNQTAICHTHELNVFLAGDFRTSYLFNTARGGIAITDTFGNVLGESPSVDLPPGEEHFLSCSATVPLGTQFDWSWRKEAWSVQGRNMAILAFPTQIAVWDP